MIWGCVLAYFLSIFIGRNGHSVGLPLAFVLNLSLFHMGGLVFLSPLYDHTLNAYLVSWDYSRNTVQIGVGASVLGLSAFTLGAVSIGRGKPNRIGSLRRPANSIIYNGSKICLFVGAASVLLDLIIRANGLAIPGFDAVIAGFNNLLILACCGFMYGLWRSKKRRELIIVTLTGATGLPLLNLIKSNVLADSVPAAFVVIAFYLILSRPSGLSLLRSIGLVVIGLYVIAGLSVAWMEVRIPLRASALSGAGVVERMEVMRKELVDLDSFDLRSQSQLELLDMRLNHNVTIGKAIESLREDPESFERGSTLIYAPIAWVPRIVWTDKPSRGGSEFVDKHLGKTTEEGTSLASGPIFEGFVNFGYLGIFSLLFSLGAILRWLDRIVYQRILSGDLFFAAPVFLAAVPMITTSNTVFFIVNSAVTAAIAGVLLRFMPNPAAKQTKHANSVFFEQK